MAMDVKNSERLLSSILDSARAEADAILAQGKERAGAIQAEAQAEAARIAQLLPAVNQTLAQGGKAPLTMGDPRPGIQGGFFLVGASYELNCSFEALLRDLRETEVSKVADLLFG